MEFDQNIIDIIKNGGVGVLPTDTIFGVVASVFKPEAVARIYEVKKRPNNKKLIVLISNRGQLPSLGVNPNSRQLEALNEFWPGPISVILKSDNTLPHVHAFDSTIAIRLPADTKLRSLINQTGPIIATSANLSSEPTPNSIEDIKIALPNLDFYIDGSVGKVPSSLAKMDEDGYVDWLNRNFLLG